MCSYIYYRGLYLAGAHESFDSLEKEWDSAELFQVRYIVRGSIPYTITFSLSISL